MNQHESFQSNNLPDERLEEFAALERQLRRSLTPVDPPAGFADRVIARSRQEQAPDHGSDHGAFPAFSRVSLRSRFWIGGAIAAMLLAGVAGRQIHETRQRHKADEAQRQFETALQITDRALDHARLQLQRAGVSLE